MSINKAINAKVALKDYYSTPYVHISAHVNVVFWMYLQDDQEIVVEELMKRVCVPFISQKYLVTCVENNCSPRCCDFII